MTTDGRINQLVKSQLGVSGVIVLAVEEKTIAAQIGLQASKFDKDKGFNLGNIILAINDIDVSNRRELIKALSEVHNKPSWRTKVLRQQQIIELEWRA